MPPPDVLEIAAEQQQKQQQQQQQQRQEQPPFPPQPSSSNDSEDGPSSPRSLGSATKAKEEGLGSGMRRLRESEKRLRESNTELQVWCGVVRHKKKHSSAPQEKTQQRYL